MSKNYAIQGISHVVINTVFIVLSNKNVEKKPASWMVNTYWQREGVQQPLDNYISHTKDRFRNGNTDMLKEHGHSYL